MNHPLTSRVWELAGEIGRANRAVDPDSSLGYTLERAANHILTIDTMIRPSAAEVGACTYPGDDPTIVEALRLSDEHWDRLHVRLGKEKP